MTRSFTDTILSQSGKLYLQLRLRSKEKVERELAVKYDNHYRNAGLMLLFDVLMALGVVAIVGLVAIVLYFTTT